jgi:hypothetical protein
MAYKFQLGAATLSGSVTLKEAAEFEAGFSNNEQDISNVGDINADSISVDAAGNGLTIDGSGANNGLFKISMKDNVGTALDIMEGSNSYLKFDTQNGSEVMVASHKVRLADDTKLAFGAADDASFEYDEDGTDTLLYAGASLRISDDTKLEFGSGGDASFEYDEDGNDVLLYAGANIRIPDDTKIEFGASGDAGIEYDENGTDQLRIHAATAGLVVDMGGNDVFAIDNNANITIAGNLTVQGETTTVDSTTINISSSFTFEGPADAHETTLDSGTPISDTIIKLPQLGVAGTYFLPALAADPGGAGAISASVDEINLLDGGTARGTTAVASGDGFIHNDAGTMRMTSIDKIADFFAGDGLAVSSGVLAVGVDDTGIEINSDALRLKDNGVTLAKMAGITRGSIIHGDSSGDPAYLAKGGANTVLSSDGTDVSYTQVSNAMLAGSIADGKLNQLTTAGKVALSALEIDGASDIGEALADADLLIVDNGAGGTNRKVAMSRIKTYIGAGTTTVASGSNAATLVAGVNFFGAHGGAITATLPGATEPTVGDTVRIKAGSDCSTTNKLTVSGHANHTIDGASSIILESPFAAVDCVYVVSGSWRVF